MHGRDRCPGDIGFFFDRKPGAAALYEVFAGQMRAAFPAATVKAQKSQISFYGRHLFAMVSLPRRRAEEGIVVSFGLPYRLDSPRIAIATQPYPNRWTHHLTVTDPAQLDGEVMGWLREAWAFSESK